jgi:hypothetical protein
LSIGRALIAVTVAVFALPAVAQAAPSVTFTSLPNEGAVTVWSVAGGSVFFNATGDAPLAMDCSLDGEAFHGCTDSRIQDVGPLPDGSHALQVRATDAHGDATTATRHWIVDNTAPVIGFPGDVTGTPETTVIFSVTDANVDTVTCSIDGGDYGPCTSAASQTASGLADGPHSVGVKAVDKAGNKASASRDFTVDASSATPDGPALSITGGPEQGAWVTDRDVTLSFATAAGDVECAIDAGAYGPCTAAAGETATGLSDGVHDIRVRAHGAGDAQTTVARWFRVDATPPALEIEWGLPDGATIADGNPYWFVISSDAHFAALECSMDGAAYASCCMPDSPPTHERPCGTGANAAGGTGLISLSWIPDGVHHIHIRARDMAGNISLLARSWLVAGSTPLDPPGGGPPVIVIPPPILIVDPPGPIGPGPIVGDPRPWAATNPPPSVVATPRAIAAKLTVTATRHGHWAKLRAVRVAGVPAGAQVRVTGAGKAARLTARKSGTLAVTALAGRRVRAGTVLTVRLSRAGMTAQTLRTAVR